MENYVDIMGVLFLYGVTIVGTLTVISIVLLAIYVLLNVIYKQVNASRLFLDFLVNRKAFKEWKEDRKEKRR